MSYAPTLVVLAAVSAGAGQPTMASELARGGELYRAHCQECHGEGGRGDGPTARKLGVSPRDMTLGSYKCRCTESGEVPVAADLVRTVTGGLPGTAMLAFGEDLPADDIDAVVAYVMSLSPRFAADPAPECLPIPEPPPPSPGAVEAGEQLYRALACWQCHGRAGRGDGPAADGLRDDWGLEVKTHDFTRRNKFKCGGEARDIFRTLRTGLDGTPMPSYSSALLVGSEAGDDVSAVAEYFGDEEARALAAWLDTQPTAAEIAALGDAERRGLIDRRTWALARYVRALADRRSRGGE